MQRIIMILGIILSLGQHVLLADTTIATPEKKSEPVVVQAVKEQISTENKVDAVSEEELEKKKLQTQVLLIKNALLEIIIQIDNNIADLEKESSSLRDKIKRINSPDKLDKEQKKVIELADTVQKRLQLLEKEIAEQKSIAQLALKKLKQFEAKIMTY